MIVGGPQTNGPADPEHSAHIACTSLLIRLRISKQLPCRVSGATEDLERPRAIDAGRSPNFQHLDARSVSRTERLTRPRSVRAGRPVFRSASGAARRAASPRWRRVRRLAPKPRLARPRRCPAVRISRRYRLPGWRGIAIRPAPDALVRIRRTIDRGHFRLASAREG